MASYDPFDTLPIEVPSLPTFSFMLISFNANFVLQTNQHIASFLEYDEDVCNFALICQSTANAVEADGCSFWRRRFLSQYEKPSWTQPNNLKYKQAYQRRRMVLKNGAIFKQGDGPKERRCLEHLRDLIVGEYLHLAKKRWLKTHFLRRPANSQRRLLLQQQSIKRSDLRISECPAYQAFPASQQPPPDCLQATQEDSYR